MVDQHDAAQQEEGQADAAWNTEAEIAQQESATQSSGQTGQRRQHLHAQEPDSKMAQVEHVQQKQQG